jgi:hypothetical protein
VSLDITALLDGLQGGLSGYQFAASIQDRKKCSASVPRRIAARRSRDSVRLHRGDGE